MRRSAFATIAILLAASAARPSRAVEPVSVAAGADKGYVLQKFGDGKAHTRPESYFFAKGTFFDGGKSDASLKNTSFMAIVHELTPDLARQKYYPSKEPRNADLLIVVHWGMTSIVDDATNGQADMDNLMADLKAFNAGLQKSSIMDSGFVNSDLAIMGGKSAQGLSSMEANAQLTGYLSEFRKAEYESLGLASGMSDEDRRLREDLGSERYFVILMAYDYTSLRDEKRLGTKPTLLWSTHISISAVGRNFTEALPAMGRVGAGYFGHQEDGLLLNIREVPAGKVDIGTPRTVDEHRTE
jgi:hypothetical protein